jgi:hypothetical protein
MLEKIVHHADRLPALSAIEIRPDHRSVRVTAGFPYVN